MYLGLCAQDETDLEKAKLNGKVRAILVVEHFSEHLINNPEKLREVAFDPTLNSYYEAYNYQGYTTESWKKWSDDFWKTSRRSYHYKHQYDGTGTKLLKTKDYSEKLELKRFRTYTYDPNNGKVMELWTKFPNGQVKSMTRNFYDSLGNITASSIWTGSTNTGEVTYKYDKDGNLTDYILKSTYMGRDMGTHNTMKYDEKGNMIQIHRNGKLAPPVTEKYAYEGDKVVEKLAYNHLGKLEQKERFKYDKHGSLIQIKFEDSSGTGIIGITYTYDSQNNWIKSIRWVKGKAERTTTREIEYYP